MTRNQLGRMIYMRRRGWQNSKPDGEPHCGGPCDMEKNGETVVVENDGSVVSEAGDFYLPPFEPGTHHDSTI